MFYLTFRIKYAIRLPFMWCSTCTERRHLRFHFFNGLFSVFTVIVIIIDWVLSGTKNEGLYFNCPALFVYEFFSLAAALVVIVCIWRYPRLIYSRRAADREVDLNMRREQRNRFSYGVPDNDPEERRREEEEFKRRHPAYETLDIEEVILENQY